MLLWTTSITRSLIMVKERLQKPLLHHQSGICQIGIYLAKLGYNYKVEAAPICEESSKIHTISSINNSRVINFISRKIDLQIIDNYQDIEMISIERLKICEIQLQQMEL